MDNTRPAGRLITAALVIGAIAFTLADLIRRAIIPGGATVADGVAGVAAHTGPWLVAGLLSVAAPFVMLPGIAAAGRAVSGRGVGLARTGTVLLYLGLLAAVGHAVAFYGMEALYVKAPLAGDALTRFDDESNRYPLFFVLIILFIAGLTLGPILLTLGLRRARLVPVWVPVVAVVFAVAGTVGGVPAGIVGMVAAAVTFAMVGRLLTRREHPAGALEPAVS